MNELIEKVAEYLYMQFDNESALSWSGFNDHDSIQADEYRHQAREIIALFQPMFDEVREHVKDLKLHLKNTSNAYDLNHYDCDHITAGFGLLGVDIKEIDSLIPTAPDEPQDEPKYVYGVDVAGGVRTVVVCRMEGEKFIVENSYREPTDEPDSIYPMYKRPKPQPPPDLRERIEEIVGKLIQRKPCEYQETLQGEIDDSTRNIMEITGVSDD